MDRIYSKDCKKEKKVKVSVIIPVYNTEKYIKRAVNSVLSQEFREFEIILVDDGSTDNSWAVCKEIAEADNRVCLFHQEHTGVSAARNLALKQCRGEYIFFLDSDDEYRQNLLQKVVHIFEICKCDCVRFQNEYVKENITSQISLDESWEVYSQKDFIINALNRSDMYRNMNSSCFGAYKRENIENSALCFKEELAIGEDGVFVMEYLLGAQKIVYMKDILYTYYNFEPQNRISTMSPQIKAVYDAYKIHFMMYNMVYEKYRNIFNQEEKTKIYFKFYDQMIGYLVRFAAYSGHLKWIKVQRMLRELLDSDLMEEAGQHYKIIRKTDSKWIPLFYEEKKGCCCYGWR